MMNDLRINYLTDNGWTFLVLSHEWKSPYGNKYHDTHIEDLTLSEMFDLVKKEKRLMTEEEMRRPATRRWDMMGAELEGAWDIDPKSVANAVKGAVAKQDQSVKQLPGIMGEIVTRPHRILDNLLEDIKNLYPKHTNNTCGFHLHASFPLVDFNLLTQKEFYDYFLTRFEKWGKEWLPGTSKKVCTASYEQFWQRLSGGVHFTKREHIPERQLMKGQPNEIRYTQLNYGAYLRHKTIECRLFPQFKEVELAIAATMELSDIFDTYLNQAKLEIKMNEELHEIGGEIVEQKIDTYGESDYWEEVKAGTVDQLVYGDDVFYHYQVARQTDLLPFGSSDPEDVESP